MAAKKGVDPDGGKQDGTHAEPSSADRKRVADQKSNEQAEQDAVNGDPGPETTQPTREEVRKALKANENEPAEAYEYTGKGTGVVVDHPVVPPNPSVNPDADVVEQNE